MLGMFNYLLTGAQLAAGSGSGDGTRSAQLAVDSALIPVESRIDALELACAAMWELLKTKGGLTDEELVRTIQEIDARDGSIDGKMRPTLENCPTCNRRIVTRSRKRCVWCGAELRASPF